MQEKNEDSKYIIYSVAWYSNKHKYYRSRNAAFFNQQQALDYMEDKIKESKDNGWFGASIAVFKEFYENPCSEDADADSVDTFTKSGYTLLFSNPVASEKSKTIKGGKYKGGLIG